MISLEELPDYWEQREYERLHSKLKDGTATQEEKDRLFVLAFGTEFMKSDDKGRLKEY